MAPARRKSQGMLACGACVVYVYPLEVWAPAGPGVQSARWHQPIAHPGFFVRDAWDHQSCGPPTHPWVYRAKPSRTRSTFTFLPLVSTRSQKSQISCGCVFARDVKRFDWFSTCTQKRLLLVAGINWASKAAGFSYRPILFAKAHQMFFPGVRSCTLSMEVYCFSKIYSPGWFIARPDTSRHCLSTISIQFSVANSGLPVIPTHCTRRNTGLQLGNWLIGVPGKLMFASIYFQFCVYLIANWKAPEIDWPFAGRWVCSPSRKPHRHPD